MSLAAMWKAGKIQADLGALIVSLKGGAKTVRPHQPANTNSSKSSYVPLAGRPDEWIALFYLFRMLPCLFSSRLNKVPRRSTTQVCAYTLYRCMDSPGRSGRAGPPRAGPLRVGPGGPGRSTAVLPFV